MSVSLFPDVQVTVDQRDKFYLAVAHLNGYVEDGDGGDPSNWVNNAGIAAFVRNVLIEQAREAHRASKDKRYVDGRPPKDTYDLGV